ncbi:MAG TPA: MipA/OmpV family protein, partial [Stellaceae bacterium]|nr:MipA/OmpV family protein [Stellaceae bacterium]
MAHAQTAAPLAAWQSDPGVVLRPLGGPPPDWEFTLGLGGGVFPAYEGSNSYRPVPSPNIDVRYKDLAFLSTGEGIGVNLLRGATYRAGVAITYDYGREHNYATRLSGTGNIDPAATPKIFAEFAVLPVIFSLDLRYRATSQQGFVGDVSVYMPVVANDTLQVFLGPSATFADDNYMNTYFGITPNHAAPHSQFQPYTASGGTKNVNFGATALYHFNDHWFVDLDAGVERLVGSAENSPIVQTRWGYGADAVLCYTW